METTPQALVRLSVNMNQETADALRTIADRRGQTFTETIRRAVALLAYLDERATAGVHIYLGQSNDQIERELVIL